MVIDSSALVAILFGEAEAFELAKAIAGDPVRVVSAATLLETSMVVEARHREAGGRELDLLLLRAKIGVIPVDHDQVEIAQGAWRRFGKGHHPAGLNYGDCFSYALAIRRGEPLLFKGDDFTRTDVRPAA